MSEALRAARARRRRSCSSSPSEDHFGHLDPANPLWKAVVEWLLTPRATPPRSTRADPLAAFRERFVIADAATGSTSTATRSAGCPLATRDRLARARRRVGRASSSPAGTDWIDAPRARRRRCSPSTCSARGPARCSSATRRRSTSTSCARAVLDARAAARSSPTATTSRPTATCSRASPRSAAASCGWSTTPEQAGAAEGAGARRALATSPTARARSPTWRRSRRARARGATWSGTSRHSAGAVPVDLRARRRRARRRLHLQVPQRRARARPRSSTSREELQAQLRSPIWGWFGQRDQFAMERAYDPVDGIGALPGRHAADPRARRRRGGRAADRRGRHRRAAREVDRA